MNNNEYKLIITKFTYNASNLIIMFITKYNKKLNIKMII